MTWTKIVKRVPVERGEISEHLIDEIDFALGMSREDGAHARLKSLVDQIRRDGGLIHGDRLEGLESVLEPLEKARAVLYGPSSS